MDSKDVVIALVKQTILHKTFRGNFINRQLVRDIGEYRDIVEVKKGPIYHSLVTTYNIIKETPDIKVPWLGINLENEKCFLWVQLASDITFGDHLFTVDSLVWNKAEFTFKLSGTSYTGNTEVSAPAKILDNLAELLTASNIKECLKFLTILLVTAVYGLFHGLWFLLDAFVKVAHLGPRYIQAATPFLLGCVDCVTKCVGGLYLLIAMCFGSNRRPVEQPPQIQRTLQYPSNRANNNRPIFNDPNNRYNRRLDFLQPNIS